MSEQQSSAQTVGRESAPFFTVFTPTYNRAHTLHRVFDSLCAQTFRDFEWLVVDDGSTDDTRAVLDAWMNAAHFPIRYFRQPNSGKHIAHNRAIGEARGQMFVVVDSDDALVPNALERASRLWHDIPEVDRSRFCGVGGRCRDQRGRVIGIPFPESPFDTDFRQHLFVHRRFGGEKSQTLRTDVLRSYPFPEIARSNFVPEGLIGLQMARTHKLRFVNEVFRVYYVDDSETGVTLGSRDSVAKAAPGRLYYYIWLLNREMEYFRRSPAPFIKAAAMLPVLSRFAGRPLREVWRELDHWHAKLLALAAFPVALPLVIFHEFQVRSK